MERDVALKGLVLREENIGEGDKIITLLTGEKGRITVSCKGARSLKSKRFYAVQLFTFSDLVIGESKGRYFLKEAEVIESFVGIRESLEAISLAAYIAEVASAVTVEEQNESAILSLVLNSFYMLSKKGAEISLVKSVFETRIAAELGFEPILDSCSVCGKDKGEFYLDLTGGVLMCSECVFGGNTGEYGGAEGRLVYLDSALLELFGYIMRCPPKKIFSFKADKATLDALAELSESYLLAHVERGFSTLDFLKNLI
jgi:DNA repair protein RecO (recombination protein O)